MTAAPGTVKAAEILSSEFHFSQIHNVFKGFDSEYFYPLLTYLWFVL